MLFQVLNKDPLGSLLVRPTEVCTFTYTSEVHSLITCTQYKQTLQPRPTRDVLIDVCKCKQRLKGKLSLI